MFSNSIDHVIRKKDEEDKEENIDSSSTFEPSKQHQKCSALATSAISDLPYDVMEYILELAVGTKKSPGFLNASLVCRQWNRLISQSPKIMYVLRPIVDLSQPMNVTNSMGISFMREYRNLELWNNEEKNQTAMMSTISTSLSNSLRSLSLSCRPFDPCYFDALSSLTFLESLSLIACSAVAREIHPITLSQLKHFVISESSDCIFDWINCKKLKTFTYFTIDPLGPSTVKFLNQLEKLDELILIAWEWEDNVPKLTPKFKWNELELRIPYNHSGSLSDIARFSLIALGLASAENGKAHIIFESNWLYDSDEAELSVQFMNSCKKIKKLTIQGEGWWGQFLPIKADLSTLRVLDEVETLSMEANFNEIFVLPGLRNLMEKLPNAKEVTLNLTDIYWDFMEGVDLDLNADEPAIVRFRNISSLTVDVSLKREINRSPIGYESTASMWRSCSFGSALKQLKFNICQGPFWKRSLIEGVETENSLIQLYKDWTSAENRSSVESCILNLNCYGHHTFCSMNKTRDDVELEIFGRLLNEDEKKFFSEITFSF